MYIYIYIYIEREREIYICIDIYIERERAREILLPCLATSENRSLLPALVGTGYSLKGVQSEGGAADGGSSIDKSSI